MSAALLFSQVCYLSSFYAVDVWYGIFFSADFLSTFRQKTGLSQFYRSLVLSRHFTLFFRGPFFLGPLQSCHQVSFRAHIQSCCSRHRQLSLSTLHLTCKMRRRKRTIRTAALLSRADHQRRRHRRRWRIDITMLRTTVT